MTGPRLERYLQMHNHGVLTGDFEPMLSLFAPEAVLRFQTIPVGPFHGIEAIRNGFRDHPPDDELVLSTPIQESADGETAAYAWATEPARMAGTLRCTVDTSGRIRMLVVS